MLTSRWSTFRVLMLAMIAGIALSALPAAMSAKEHDKHCIVHLEPAKDGQPSTSTNGACVDTLAESVAIATKGRVKLPKTATPDEIDQALRANDASVAGTQATYVLSIEYQHTQYGGTTYTFTGATPCTSSPSYYVNGLASDWNDEISSSRSYSNCNRVRHWEHTYRSGASLNCPCYTMGAMNDRTSSIAWHNQ